MPGPRKALHMSHLLLNLTLTLPSTLGFGNGYVSSLFGGGSTEKLRNYVSSLCFSLFPVSDFMSALTHSDACPCWRRLHTTAHPRSVNGHPVRHALWAEIFDKVSIFRPFKVNIKVKQGWVSFQCSLTFLLLMVSYAANHLPGRS